MTTNTKLHGISLFNLEAVKNGADRIRLPLSEEHLFHGTTPFQPGQILYVMEALKSDYPPGFPSRPCVHYAIEGDLCWSGDHLVPWPLEWPADELPADEMPPEAARYWLRIKNIEKVEMLKQATLEDIELEGLVIFDCDNRTDKCYSEMWNAHYGPNSYESNPWTIVYSVEFMKEKPE